MSTTPRPVHLPYGLTVDQAAKMTNPQRLAFLDAMQAEGACRGHDPELWFPLSSGAEHATAAVGICQRCPLVATCLTYALSAAVDVGVWGAHTDRQRRPWLRAVSARRQEIVAEEAVKARKTAV